MTLKRWARAHKCLVVWSVVSTLVVLISTTGHSRLILDKDDDERLIVRDVERSDSFASAVATVIKEGILVGSEEQRRPGETQVSFKPDVAVTRKDLAVVVDRTLDRLNAVVPEKQAADRLAGSEVKWAEGLLTINPSLPIDEFTTRAPGPEAVTALVNEVSNATWDEGVPPVRAGAFAAEGQEFEYQFRRGMEQKKVRVLIAPAKPEEAGSTKTTVIVGACRLLVEEPLPGAQRPDTTTATGLLICNRVDGAAKVVLPVQAALVFPKPGPGITSLPPYSSEDVRLDRRDPEDSPPKKKLAERATAGIVADQNGDPQCVVVRAKASLWVIPLGVLVAGGIYVRYHKK